MKRWGFLAIAVLYICVILFANRAAYTSRFDPAYWKNRYEHSQWQLPVSSRTIGDDGLYLFEGWQLINGADPTKYNAEVPPLGKYLIGASILLTGNGNWFGFAATFGSLIIFFYLTKKLLKNTFLAMTATVLFATNPLLIAQFPLTMLDSIQLLFLLLTFYLLASNANTAFIGLSFGLFASIKTPLLYGPLLTVILLIFLRKPKSILLLLTAAAATYVFSYFRFFLLGHTIIDWVNLQRWMVGFYRNSLLTPNPGSALFALVAGRMQNLFSHVWESSGIWSPVWTLAAIFSIFLVFKQKITSVWFPIITFVAIYFLIQNVIPFWTRYLILILPFLYLLCVQFLSTLNKTIFIILTVGMVLINIISSANSLFPTPEATVADFTYSWEHGFFQDMYEHLAPSSKTTDRSAFHRLGLQTEYDGQIEAATIRVDHPNWSRWISPQTVNLTVTYFTRELGPFTEHRTITVARENGAWVVNWQWSDLIEGFNETKHLETIVIPGKRGSIIDVNGRVLAGDAEGYMAWITPSMVDQTKEQAMLAELETAFHRLPGAAEIHERYVDNVLPERPIAIGVVLSPTQKFPGLSFTPHFIRIPTIGIANTQYKECCSFLYSTTTYDGTMGLEEQHNETIKGKNGGTLIMRSSEGMVIRTILDETKSDGRSVSFQP